MKSPDSKPKSPKRKYKIEIYKDWCKRCGICVEFCPKSVFDQDESGYPRIKDADACIGCRECEILCPDFAIEIINDEE